MSGVAQGFLANWLGMWARPVARGVVGWWRKNPTLQTLAGEEAGVMVAGGIGGQVGGFVGQ